MNTKALHQLFLKYPTVSTDTRNITKNSIFFALKGANFNGNTYALEALKKGAAYAIVDEKEHATSDNIIYVHTVLKTLQELGSYHRNYCSAKVIGLTGSNGKTTTKELIHTVLSRKYKTVATKGNLNNHIGVPLTLLSIQPNTEIAIVEMGANHQKEIEFLCELTQPDFGYITNFGKAHLEGFGSEEGVIKGKSELYDYLLSNDQSIFMNADDPIQLEKLGSHIEKFGFSTTNNQFYIIEFLEANPFVQIKVENTIINSQLIGSYNFTNCAAAILIGKFFNIQLEDVKIAIEGYTPENNRSQILEKNGHQIILDAYNANPTSMKAALESFKALKGENKAAFLGDMFELGKTTATEHQNIADLVNKIGVSEVYFIGENFNKVNTSFKTFKSFDAATNHLKEHSLESESHILIKGSRGMALERLLKHI